MNLIRASENCTTTRAVTCYGLPDSSPVWSISKPTDFRCFKKGHIGSGVGRGTQLLF
ncbi:hypothetical protein IQ238_03255 [Pleurocapsales cyanobacterium LEGE 06147]|nr:hypothetical protein [Pleurocapsales cyanobacterium LEGE 06147]